MNCASKLTLCSGGYFEARAQQGPCRPRVQFYTSSYSTLKSSFPHLIHRTSTLRLPFIRVPQILRFLKPHSHSSASTSSKRLFSVIISDLNQFFQIFLCRELCRQVLQWFRRWRARRSALRLHPTRTLQVNI